MKVLFIDDHNMLRESLSLALQNQIMDFEFLQASSGKEAEAALLKNADCSVLLLDLRIGNENGLSLLGGEPFEPQNQRALLPFLKKVRERYPNKTIWCYTGYLFDKELLEQSRARCECTDEMLSLIDVLVDGEFVQSLYDISLQFRGSSNQRIIDVQKSLSSGEIVLYEPASGKL